MRKQISHIVSDAKNVWLYVRRNYSNTDISDEAGVFHNLSYVKTLDFKNNENVRDKQQRLLCANMAATDKR